MQKKYPDCFPDNIEELITADGAGAYEYTYYRVCKDGSINRDAFKSTFEECLEDNNSVHNRDIFLERCNAIDIGDYSTSGFEKLRDAKSILKCKKKYHDGPIIVVGQTVPACGLCMRTKDSKSRHARNSHIDWWIYKDAHPEVYFEQYFEETGGKLNEDS